VSYLIFKGQIWSKEKSKLGNRRYTGSNPHNKHLHISINATDATDTSPWFWWMNQPKLINQVKAAVAAVPTKKAYPAEDTSKCCQHCPSKK
jgi:hypothetical protein